MRDPSLLRGPDGVYHLVWTTGWRKDQGFGYAQSKDLVHWSPQQFIPVMEHEPTTVNVWAPELFYDEPNEQFIIIWASTIPGRFPDHVEPRVLAAVESSRERARREPMGRERHELGPLQPQQARGVARDGRAHGLEQPRIAVCDPERSREVPRNPQQDVDFDWL